METPYKITRREERVYIEFTPPIDFMAPSPYSGKVRKFRATSMEAVFEAGELKRWTVTTNTVKADGTLAQAAPVEFKGRRNNYSTVEEHLRPFESLAKGLSPRQTATEGA
uniref:hypothetical protein n=1 Tax=Nonomuraea sp. CA-251285 TaxID=3240002 RepID=UPI003F494098